MSVTVNFFETLCQRFPTWSELRAHLESPEGGSIRVVEPAEGSNYAVLRYVKGQSNLASPELGAGLFRSVVWNVATNRPVCLAPPKAREGAPPVATPLAATEEFMDGFMVNAFVEADQNLVVATRTQLGGNNSFYSKKTFGEMFDEALATTPLKDRAQLTLALGAGTYTSFVVQHPEHRVVAKTVSPALYLVHIGSVSASGIVTQLETPALWPAALQRLQITSYPIKQFHKDGDAEDLLRRQAVQRGWRWQGLVFKDAQGNRWRMRSPTYTMLRELRGSEATTEERFLRLRAQKKVDEYLKHYSEDRKLFWDMEQKLRARTMDVLLAYRDVHKAHSRQFKELPDALRPAVFLLHVKWRDELRPKGFTVRLQNAIEVVNGMRSFEQKRLMETAEYVPAVTPTEDTAPAAEEQTE
jgi:hypothetical protein